MKKYKQEKMVSWFKPEILINSGLRTLVSLLFGNYVARRELEAALDNITVEEGELEKVKKKYCSTDDIWVDFVSDTGDGFNSTFAVAKTVAKKQLELGYQHPSVGNINKVVTN